MSCINPSTFLEVIVIIEGTPGLEYLIEFEEYTVQIKRIEI
jgi:hypothetical protein